MTRNQVLIIGGLVGGAALLALLIRPKGEVDDWRIDPALGRHRGMPIVGDHAGGGKLALRLPSAQDPKPSADFAGYPYRGDQHPSAYAQGFWTGKVRDFPLGYSPLDYGEAPLRIPKLWKDGIRYWDGVAQRGATQQNYRVFLFHLRPSMPTRGFRSISGVLYNGGPTASRARIPAVYVPSVVA